MIRRFLAREKQRLLDEFDAPNLGILLWRAALCVCCTAGIVAILLGLVAVYAMFGLPAMAAIVFLLFLIALRIEGTAPVYGDDWPDQTRLPPPGNRALPPPGMRAITDNRSHTRMLK